MWPLKWMRTVSPDWQPSIAACSSAQVVTSTLRLSACAVSPMSLWAERDLSDCVAGDALFSSTSGVSLWATSDASSATAAPAAFAVPPWSAPVAFAVPFSGSGVLAAPFWPAPSWPAPVVPDVCAVAPSDGSAQATERAAGTPPNARAVLSAMDRNCFEYRFMPRSPLAPCLLTRASHTFNVTYSFLEGHHTSSP